VGKLHLRAAQLMDTYGEQYVLIERDEDLGINMRFRTPGIFRGGLTVESMRWNYRLEGRSAWVDKQECEISNIKWQIIVEAK
jgi:hypothetical protein